MLLALCIIMSETVVSNCVFMSFVTLLKKKVHKYGIAQPKPNFYGYHRTH